MRIIERDKKILFIANYKGKEEILKDGLRTGEYALTYKNPRMVRAYFSIPRSTRESGNGSRMSTPMGNVTHYIRTIYSNVDLNLTIDDLVWLEEVPVDAIDANDEADGNPMWDEGGYYYGGLFHPWGLEDKKPNYQVQSVGHSFHHHTYLLREL